MPTPVDAFAFAVAAAAAAPKPMRGCPPSRHNAPVCHPDYYELKRPSHPALRVTRHIISCVMDLHLKQVAEAFGISFTTIKKMRIWSGLQFWPRKQICSGRYPSFSFECIRAMRQGTMGSLDPERDADLLAVLRRAERISRGMPAEEASDASSSSDADAHTLTDADLEGLPLFTEAELDELARPLSPSTAEVLSLDDDCGDDGLLGPWGGDALGPAVL